MICLHVLDYYAAVNCLPVDELLDRFKFKAFADKKTKLNVNEKQKFDFRRIENIVVKGENAGYQHFLLFPQCFERPASSESLKVETAMCGKASVNGGG